MPDIAGACRKGAKGTEAKMEPEMKVETAARRASLQGSPTRLERHYPPVTDVAAMKIHIRHETEADIVEIADVTRRAFEAHRYSSGTEAYIIEALRRADMLFLSLVAESNERIIGHIAFSPVTISDASPGWYGLGPLSVLPEFQRTGIGTRLVLAGLDILRGRRARGCALLGEPEFYERFGFSNDPDLVLEGVPPEYFQVVSFDPAARPRGTVTFHPAFSAK